jgi:SAM-dependent methyltransferase
MDITESTSLLTPEEKRHPWERARLQILEELLRKTAKDRELPNGIVVDIGCGDLFVARKFAHRWPDTNFIGIDTAFDESTLETLRNNIDVPNLHAYASVNDAFASLSRPASVILLNDVIEHVPDDIEFLRSIVSSPLFAPNTRLLITVPAFQSLWTRHDVFLGHYRRYSRDLLKRRVEAAGLRIARDGYFFLSLLPLRAAQAALERAGVHAKEEKGIGAWGGGKTIGSFFRQMLLLDFHISSLLGKTGVALPGLSCYAICTAQQS